MAETPDAIEDILKKVAAQLQCAKCLETYRDPRLLPCFHISCKHCLEQLVTQDRDGLRLSCPNCHHSSLLPPTGVSGLPSALHTHNLSEIRDALMKAKDPQKTQCEKCKKATANGYCRDCGKFVCDKCTEVHQMWEELSTHQIVDISDVQAMVTSFLSPRKKASYCTKHPKSILKVYCETCAELICNDCTVRLHHGHQYDLVTDTFPKHREEIVSSLKPVEQHLSSIDQALQTLDTRAKEVSDQKMAIEAGIYEQVDQLQQTLEQRRKELIEQLGELAQQKLKGLEAQRNQLELLRSRFTSCKGYVEGSLKTGSEGEILAVKAPMLKQVAQIATEFNPSTLAPQETANMLLVADDVPQISKACHRFADVVLQVADPAQCRIRGEGLKVATVGETATVTVHPVDRDGRDYQVPVADIVTELVSCKDGSSIECTIEREGESEYMVTYKPVTKGKHLLHIKINGESIHGSPYEILVRPPLQSFGKPIRCIECLKQPWGVTTDSKGRIIAAEKEGNRVSVYTSEGKKILSFGNKGTADGEFTYPCGVTVDGHENIFVVDRYNHRIQKFTSRGEFITSFGKEGNGTQEFSYPTGISFSSKNGKLYVCDQCNHRIQIFKEDLTLSGSFGSYGSGEGQFQYPRDVSFDNAGNVYVTDLHNHRVQVFTPEGQFLRKFGSKGSGKGQLNFPSGVAVDNSSTVFVVESDNFRVSIFTAQGQFLNSFGSKGNGTGQFKYPHGIQVDDNGFIYVCDTGNNRIQIF